MAKQVLPVRNLLELDRQEILNGLLTDLEVQWEDGVVELVPYRELILTRYLLDLFVVVPQIKITSKYRLSKYYSNGFYTGKALTKWVEEAVKDIIFTVVKPANDRGILEGVYRELWEIFNRIYNDVVYKAINFAGSLSIEDLLEIQMDDRLLESMFAVSEKKTPESVQETYRVLDDIINNKKEIRQNQVVKGYISNAINTNQVKQMLGSRGYVTEIDNKIFKDPIASSFVLGMQNLYEQAVESRTGAKALHVSTQAIKDSEYFARELQIVAMVLERLVDGDCGQTDYVDWYVRPKTETNKADLPNLLGKRFYNPETKQEEIITKDHTHLVGKTIKLRSAVNCKLKDPKHICTACFGELSYSIPKNTNIGHYCCVEITEKISQGILSTKHHVFSAVSGDIVLDKISELFFNVKSGNSYLFKPLITGNKTTKYQLLIDQYSGFGIKDLTQGVDVNRLNPQRVARIRNIQIRKEEGDKVELFPIQIQVGNKYGSFTREFLDYILNVGYALDDQDNYVIDLSKWDPKKQVIDMPEIEYDFLTLLKQFQKEFKNMSTDKEGIGYETPESLIAKIFDILNFKLDINIALLEVIVTAFTVKDPDNGNYSIARGVKDKKLGKIQTVVRNRSLGAGYGWEYVTRSILSPRSFKGHNAVEHPLDVLIKPNEVIMKHYGKLDT